MRIINASLFDWVVNASKYVKRWFFSLNGVDQSISVPQFDLSSVNFELRMKVKFDVASIGVSANLLSDGDGISERLIKNSSNELQFGYVDAWATNRFVTLSSLTVAPDTEYEIAITSDGNGVTLSETNSGESATNANVIDPSDVNIIRIGANSSGTANFTAGAIYDVRWTDNTSIQNGEFVTGNGTDLYGQVSPITLSGDFDISLELIYQEGSDLRPFGSGSDDYCRMRDDDRMQLVIGGNFLTWTGAFAGVNVGQKVSIRFSRSGPNITLYLDGRDLGAFANSNPVIIDTAYQGGSGGFYTNVIANLLINDIPNSTTYQYLMNNATDNGDGTGLVPNTGSTDRFGPDLWTNPPSVVGSEWANNGDGSYTLTGSGAFSELQMSGLTAGSVVTIEFDIDSIDGQLRISSVASLATYTTTGRKSITGVLSGGFVFFTRNAGVVNATISNITIKETTDLLLQNFADPDDITTVARIDRFYPIGEGQGTNVRDSKGTGTTDGTIVNGTDAEWVEK